MRNNTVRVLILLGAVSLPSLAQAQLTPPAPVRQSVDANGVDLFAGTMNVKTPVVSIGGGRGQGLAYFHINNGAGWADNITAALNENGNAVTVRLGGKTDQFTDNGGGNFSATQGNGATLTQSGNIYTYTSSDGTVVRFSADKSGSAPYFANLGRAIDITRPSGMKLVYSYTDTQICTRSKPGGDGQICTGYGYIHRLASVANSYGYQINIYYQSDDTGQTDDGGASGLNLGPWSTVASVSLYNNQNYGAGSYSQSNSPTGTTFTVTDAMNRTTNYRMTSDALRVAGITRPGASSESVTVGYDGSNRVSSVASAAGTWNYGYNDPGDGTRHVTVTAPSNVATQYVFDIASRRMTSMIDGLNRTSSWSYDGNGRLVTATAPEQNSVTYTYDNGQSGGRGNVTDTTYTAKPGSGQGSIATHAAYDPTCGNAATCNQPNTTTDANGNVTSYSYDPTHGGVTVVTAPAGANGVQPQVRYGYTSYTDAFGGTIWRQTSSSTCRTAAPTGCSGTADEVVTNTNYGSLAGNNFLPLSTTKRAGDNSVSATVSTGYDGLGNVISMTDPVGAVTTMSYDADRELVEAIGADPDGGGPLKPRAARINYNGDGTVASKEVGTDTGGNFQSLQQVTTTYDAAQRPIRQVVTGGGTTYSVVDTDYDAVNRLACSAVRMNAGAFGSRPYACNLGTQGSDGPDRITLTRYDQLGRVGQVVQGYGTSAAANVMSMEYRPNGPIDYAIDANGNKTAYGYDGFDRLSRTYYPQPATGSVQANGNDYDQLSYDAAGNVTSRRLRDGQSIGYSYDALNHLVSDTKPGGNVSESNAAYTWDNLGELTRAGDGNGWYSAWTYDALGRTTREASNVYANSFQYDAAGRMTRMSWDDGFYVTYGYDVLGEMTGITENSGYVPISFSYDDLGRRTQIARSNGATTGYNYDGASRLTSLAQLGNVNVTFGLGYNNAGQITSRTTSNDAYSWAGAVTTDRGYSVNGLNQYTQSGSITPTYDGRGNLTSAGGSTTYVYDTRNQLYTTGGGGLFYRPPTGLLSQLLWPTNSEAFAYAGDKLTTEVANGSILRRYVYGPGSDEPLLWYEGSGTSDRRFLHADERGSIVAVTDSSGNVSAINTYDEYGIPGANNQGRFQYTGQKWLPELGMYDYKARMYSPTLGRFLQTDPIGYADGMNWYNYVGGDPVNGRDPSGLYCDAPGHADDGAAACAAAGGHWVDDVNVNGKRLSDCQQTLGCYSYASLDSHVFIYIPGQIPEDINNTPDVDGSEKGDPPAKSNSVVCTILSLVPGNRIRLGADAAFGMGGLIDLGLGVSLEDSGRLVFDAYGGAGPGGGGIAGAGLSLDGSSTPDGWSGTKNFTLQGAYELVGLSWTHSFEGHDQYGNPGTDSGGFSLALGPRMGLAAGRPINAQYGKTLYNFNCGSQ